MMKVAMVACLVALAGCAVPEGDNSNTTGGGDGMQPRLALQIEPHPEMRESGEFRFSYNLTNVGDAPTYVAPVVPRSTIIHVEYPNGTGVEEEEGSTNMGSTGPWWWDDEDMVRLPPGGSLTGNYTEPANYELDAEADYVLVVLYQINRTDRLNVTAYPDGVVVRAPMP